MRFPIVIHKDEASSYGVTVPDLPGCFSGADSLDDAFASAREAILLHLEGMLADGEAVPRTRPIEEHSSNDDYRGGIWGFVDVDMANVLDKAVRVNITVPSRMLDAIDKWAEREGETRSSFLTKSALEHIQANSMQ